MEGARPGGVAIATRAHVAWCCITPATVCADPIGGARSANEEVGVNASVRRGPAQDPCCRTLPLGAVASPWHAVNGETHVANPSDHFSSDPVQIPVITLAMILWKYR